MVVKSEEDEFYKALERAFDSCPGHDMKIIAGDLNPK